MYVLLSKKLYNIRKNPCKKSESHQGEMHILLPHRFHDGGLPNVKGESTSSVIYSLLMQLCESFWGKAVNIRIYVGRLKSVDVMKQEHSTIRLRIFR